MARERARGRASARALKRCQAYSLRLLRECRQAQEKIREVSLQLVSAREEERKKISRDLHDVVAQALALINGRLDALRVDAARNLGSLPENIHRTQQAVEKSIEILHQFAGGLRPTEVDDLGFIRALHGYMTGLRRKTGMPMTLTASAAAERLGAAAQAGLYGIAQEALTNVVRHAQASRIEVTVQKIRRRVTLRIQDDGGGFSTAREQAAARAGRLGLVGMRERVDAIGGRLIIKSTPGEGTTIAASVPLPRPMHPTGARLKR